MQKSAPAANPDAYVQALTAWQRDRVEMLRAAPTIRIAPNAAMKAHRDAEDRR